MKLAPHRHTGRRLPKRHTSYAGLAMVMLLAGALLVGYSAAARSSSQLSITARIPANLPSGPPVITSPISGSVVTSSGITVQGTCDPGLVVRVFIATQQVAAGVCTSAGRFNARLTLPLGTSMLSARQYNSDGIASARSKAVSVTLRSSQPTGGGTSGGGGGSPSPIPEPLVVVPTTTVVGGAIKAALPFGVTIVSGQAPFALDWSWSDGLEVVVSRPSLGEVTQSHDYTAAGQYQVTVQVSDGAGQTAAVTLVAVVAGPAAIPQVAGVIDSGILLIAWPIYLFMAGLLMSFWLGERFEQRRHLARPPAPVTALPQAVTPSRVRRRWPWQLKTAVWAVLLVSGLLGGWRLFSIAGQPVHSGQVVPKPDSAASPKSKQFVGLLVSYQVPRDARPRPELDDPKLPESDIFTLNRLQLAITLRHVGLAEDTPLVVRRSDPLRYQATPLDNGGYQINGQNEVAAFVPWQGGVVEIVASGGTVGELTPMVEQVRASLAGR